MNKRFTLLLALLIGLAVVSVSFLSGCGSGSRTQDKTDTKAADVKDTGSGQAQTSEPEKKPLQLIFATNATTSTLYAASTAVSTIANKSGKVSVSLATTSGATDNIRKMLGGEADLGVGDIPPWRTLYMTDTKGKTISGKDVRALYATGPLAYGMLVREGTGVETLHDLTGKPFSAGDSGGTAQKKLKAIFTVLKIEPKYFEGTYEDAVNAYQNRVIVGFNSGAQGLYPAANAQRALAFGKAKLLGYSDEDIKLYRQAFPTEALITIPANTWYEGQVPVRVHGASTFTFTHSGIPQEAQYEIAKAYYANIPEIEKSYKGLQGFDMKKIIDFTLEVLSNEGTHVPLSAGTVQFFKEKNINIPASLIPPEYK